MKHKLAGLTLISLSLFAAMALIRPPSQASPRTPGTARAPVVVELFTSEGCSSCPPADALLARLAEEQPAGNLQLIALEEHVDYWNNLGWMDPFSSRDWTSRQYVYSSVLGNVNPYTPQMVIDGRVEFVGSHTQKARQAILEAAGNTKIPVTLAQGNSNGTSTGDFSVKVGKLEGTTRGDAAEVWLAITETGLHSAVKRGEKRSRSSHAASAITMKNNAEQSNMPTCLFSPRVDAGARKKPVRCPARGVIHSFG